MAARKGARRRSDVTADILAHLHAGTLETASLPEMLVMDLAELMKNAVPDITPHHRASLVDAKLGVVAKMVLGGQLIHDHIGIVAYDSLVAHSSDTVRGWAAYMLCLAPDVPLTERLNRIRPLADDPHFGVREWAWMAIRPHLATNLAEAITLLEPWTLDASTNIRRFAVESVRPRGVWCAHIAELKTKPELGLPLLQPLRADPTKYVQDSVSNWLNDASKSKPEWVRKLCERWRKQSQNTATERICKRAMRSLKETDE